MARKEVIKYFDDLDGTELDSSQVNILRFAFQGKSYYLDLSPENAEEFQEIMERYIQHAHVDTAASTGNSRNNTIARRDYNPTKVRVWARQAGYQISERGKIPHEIIAAYRAAN
ncbi:histone-like nucleoid-structuring protein Lsr2 [Corynebacterium caspium]|uniref:histone-like nucleoid-structuring protein Lsr2 n=1 Tax=Corynebacterium caspium TaxID=234828 RepID=UPI0003717118|nr:Lsr2 family protein [Corynebacterium caspium]WKD60008.1 Nucleoid-associated protein Lsr2 [Corynebacterium caspium DSM 44850]